MPQNPEALKALRKQTKWFIDDDPFIITLVPRVAENRPGGGVEMVAGTPRAPQTVKLVYTGSARGVAGQEGVQVTTDGRERRYDYVVVGMWDMVCEVGDYWTDLAGNRWEITGFIPNNEYERRATASAFGRQVEGG